MTRLFAIPIAGLTVLMVGLMLILPPLGNSFGDELVLIGAYGVLGSAAIALALATICTVIWGFGEEER